MRETEGRERRRHRNGTSDTPVRREGDGGIRSRGGQERSTRVLDPSRLGADRPAGQGTAAAADRSVTVETGTVSATLAGIPLVDLREVAYEHRIDRERLEAGETAQPVALFDLHNTGGVPIHWPASRTQFIGDDGYTYKPAQLSLDPSALGPGIHTRRVEVRPDCRARVATPVERLPAGVEIVEVVQTLPIRAAGTEQLVFTIAE